MKQGGDDEPKKKSKPAASKKGAQKADEKNILEEMAAQRKALEDSKQKGLLSINLDGNFARAQPVHRADDVAQPVTPWKRYDANLFIEGSSETQDNFFSLQSQFPGIMFSRLKLFFTELGQDPVETRTFLMRTNSVDSRGVQGVLPTEEHSSSVRNEQSSPRPTRSLLVPAFQ